MTRKRAVDGPGDRGIVDGRRARLWWLWADRIVRDHRDLLDATNVFPVADGDTGTNLVHTLTAVARAVDAAADADADAAADTDADAGIVLTAAARAAALGARGNSGILMSLFLSGFQSGLLSGIRSGPVSVRPSPAVDQRLEPGAAADLVAADLVAVDPVAVDLAAGLRGAAASMRAGLAQPADGTILSVAEAAADGATRGDPKLSGDRDPLADALEAAHAALIAGPERLPVLAGAGVVDAGGLALLLVLEALAAAVDDSPTELCPGGPDCPHYALAHVSGRPGSGGAKSGADDARCAVVDARSAVVEARYEVMFRVTASGEPIGILFGDLDRLGDSVAMVAAGDGTSVAHVHTDAPGAAIEAGMRAGAVAEIRIEVQPPDAADAEVETIGSISPGPSLGSERVDSVVLAFVVGAGCAHLFASVGALVYRIDRRDGLREVAQVLELRPADRVLVLPNGLLGAERVGRVADLVRDRGSAVDLVWSASTVQGLAALSVHDPARSTAEDMYAMAAAVAGTRWGTITRSRTRVLTGIGLAEAGELLARLGVEVVAIGRDPVLVTCRLLDRFLDTGGEVVTVLSGLAAPAGLEPALRRHLEDEHPGVELTVLDGGMPDDMISVGVE